MLVRIGVDRQAQFFSDGERRACTRGQRIGIARVRFNEAGEPAGIERLGIALEPEADYERRHYVMTYTALSPEGPRSALAISEDLFRWQRLGLATFRPYDGIEIDGVDNKDAGIFPVAIPDPSGQPAMAILHRLSEEHPHVIRYRSPEPVLTPGLPQERRGIVANVVFPTGIDRRDDLGSPDCVDARRATPIRLSA